MSTDDVAKRRKEMDQEFAQFRDHLGKILEAVDEVNQAGPEDDLATRLENLEDIVHKVRTGGLLGSGAKGHREAREKWLEAKKG
jgi:hypothetical protein